MPHGILPMNSLNFIFTIFLLFASLISKVCVYVCMYEYIYTYIYTYICVYLYFQYIQFFKYQVSN